MIDFTSALYLGMQHPSESLEPWQHFTLGTPAALSELAGTEEVSQGLAALQGCEQAVLLPSTLHLFWDLFGMLGKGGVSLYLDDGVYDIVRWGAERLSGHGIKVRQFRHHNPEALLTEIKSQTGSGKRPIVVADGYSPASGQLAPIEYYLNIVRRYGGLLIIDDTQSLGILGEKPQGHPPYGMGGGGILRWSGNYGSDILLGCSLAKGFGSPVAALSGSQEMIRRFKNASNTRVHCSPPSAAAIHAARHALTVNQHHGDVIRQHLATLVGRFRKGLASLGLSATGGWFPVQTLREIVGTAAVWSHHRLSRQGIKTVLARPGNKREVRLTFLLSARHSLPEIDRCIDQLWVLINGHKQPITLKHTPDNLDFLAYF